MLAEMIPTMGDNTMLSYIRTAFAMAVALPFAACGPGPGPTDAGVSLDGGPMDGGSTRPRLDSGPPCTTMTFYRDADGDGAGDPSATIEACALPDGYVADADDCDNHCAGCHPGAAESCASGRDEDCDGTIDESDCDTCGTSCAWSCTGGACDDALGVSAGGFHACALRETGAVVCWGEGEKLGSGTPADSSLPVAVRRISNAVQVTAGWAHSCARLADATLACWGANDTGALGLGPDSDTYLALSPTPVDGLTGVRDVAVGGTTGGSFTCAATTGGVSCFGYNSHGQLGDGSPSLHRSAVSVNGLLGQVEHVATGGEHACALLSDGRVQCWGANGKGQLGIGSQDDARIAAPPVASLSATTLALGEAHSCALDSSGAVWCWGANESGQLGTGDTDDVGTPAQVDGLVATSLSAGGRTTCAVDTTGQAWCWGLSVQGQLGDGTTTNSSVPVAVSSLSDAQSIDVGNSVVCARRLNATVVCWGENASGQLGDGGTNPSSVPVNVERP